MLHACVARFDMTENIKLFVIFFGTKQGPHAFYHCRIPPVLPVFISCSADRNISCRLTDWMNESIQVFIFPLAYWSSLAMTDKLNEWVNEKLIDWITELGHWVYKCRLHRIKYTSYTFSCLKINGKIQTNIWRRNGSALFSKKLASTIHH